ncbi:MAG: D-sedoheptulose 7-phosphate isomerase [Candidatus Woesearchaeota archaeon]
MLEKIKQIITESIKTKEKLLEFSLGIEKTAEAMIIALKNGKKILICGNGGSAADAQHFAAELVCRFEKDRKPLPAIALTVNTSNITAIGNDFGFDFVFSKQVEALGREGDILVAISTSGNSPNVLKAIEKAKELKIKTVLLSGKAGGKMKGLCDYELIIPTENTARIQECHILIIHTWCKLIEDELFK